MTDKECLEYIENCLDDDFNYKNATREKDKLSHSIILNLIKKQSKEIEKLYEDNLTLAQEIKELKEKNKKAINFINNENNYFEDGENWQNILKIKEILEE